MSLCSNTRTDMHKLNTDYTSVRLNGKKLKYLKFGAKYLLTKLLSNFLEY